MKGLALLLAACSCLALADSARAGIDSSIMDSSPQERLEEAAAKLKPVVYFDESGKAVEFSGQSLVDLTPGMVETASVSIWETPLYLSKISQALADKWQADNEPRLDAMIAFLQKVQQPLPDTASGADVAELADQVKRVQKANKPLEAKRAALVEAKARIDHPNASAGGGPSRF